MARTSGQKKKSPNTGAPWHPKFLDALRESGIVRAACKAAEVGRSTAYDHRDRFEAFALAWDEAAEDACDGMEAEARRRAVKGTLKPVFFQGKQCGKIREYSDTLLIFLLKANRPEKFRDNYDLAQLVEKLAGEKGGSAR